MFFHNFNYTLKTTFRDKTLIFWTFAFPIIMATFFNMAFGDIKDSEELKTIDIAIINNQEFNNNIFYREAFKELSSDNNKMFNITYANKEEADKLLNDKKITGYLELENNLPKLTFKNSGINQTVFKHVTDEINTKAKLYQSTGYIDVGINSIKIENVANSNLDYLMIEFYTLIAMTCLYGSTISMNAINKTLPYLKGNGKRVSISPIKKTSIVLSSLLASFIVELLCLGLLYLYTIGVLNIDYSSKIGYIVLISVIGTVAGIALGLVVSLYTKATENAKIGILIAITMFFSMLSGMMGVTMKYLIDSNIPILNRINPANMITDGFYSLYYYDNLDRYWSNLIGLIVFSVILLILASNKLRRTRYDSI